MEPEITRTNPQAYYYWLRQQGVGIQQAGDLLQQRFGAPKTAEDRAKDEASSQQTNALAQAGGMLAGVIGGRYIMNNAGDWIDQLTGAKAAEQTVKNVAQQTGQALPTSGSIGITRAVPTLTTTVDGSGAMVDLGGAGQTVTIETPVGLKEVPAEVAADPGFLENVDWGGVQQGAIGAYQLYQAYNAYKGGDKIGAGLYGVGGAANLAASGLLGAGAKSAVSGAAGGNLIPGVNVALGGYTGYKTAKAMGDMARGGARNKAGAMGGAASGAMIGSAFGPAGTLVGAGVGALAGLTMSTFGSSKDKYQVLRDNARSTLQEAGILDADYKGTLADGSTFDFGKDGKKYGKLKQEALGDPAAFADTIASIEGLYGRPREAVATMYANAGVSNAGGDYDTMVANMRHFAQQRGMTMESAMAQLNKLREENLISQNQFDVFSDKARILLGGFEMPQETQQVQRPAQGQVARVSPGKYMDDQGNIRSALNKQQAKKQAYKPSRRGGR